MRDNQYRKAAADDVDVDGEGCKQSWFEPDGSIRIRDLTVPPSRLWSPEYKAFQARIAVASAQLGEFPLPARTATADEWNRFDAWWDCTRHADSLREALKRYPVEMTESQIAGVRVAVISPKQGVAAQNANRILINLHGGGFVYSRGLGLGYLESIPVASLGGFKIITLDYRQAPFHSYPAATEDVHAVYQELLREYSPQAIGMFGCSAGGTLASQVLSWFQAAGIPQPRAVGIFNIAPMPACDRPPWGLDWGESGMWFTGVPRNELSELDAKFWAPVRWYMEAAEANDTRAYPGSSDAVLARFPPTLCLSGTRDFALSSVVFTHARLLKLGVDASLYIMEGGGHGAHVFALGTPEAHDAQAYIARWFCEHLAE